MTRQRSNAPSSALAGAILTIDLGAIRENYRILTSKLGGVAAAGVVKADGCGFGAEVAPRSLQAYDLLRRTAQ